MAEQARKLEAVLADLFDLLRRSHPELAPELDTLEWVGRQENATNARRPRASKVTLNRESQE